ncbi:MAG: hypothetical protein ACJAVM_000420 [Sulfitobacter sp.]|jgi:hypothetical protein
MEKTMTTSQNVPELVALAQASAKPSQERISEILEHLQDQPLTDAEIKDLRAARVALELAAVDVFTLFEARMQHHFKRGPFSRKLKAALLDAGHGDLADRIYQYYLAVNVLKHGKGASHRELLAAPTGLFAVTQTEDIPDNGEDPPAGLIDVTAPGFFEGLSATILEAHQFLENR